jgi:hypothetical protein
MNHTHEDSHHENPCYHPRCPSRVYETGEAEGHADLSDHRTDLIPFGSFFHEHHRRLTRILSSGFGIRQLRHDDCSLRQETQLTS